jgi:hypothetical protein
MPRPKVSAMERMKRMRRVMVCVVMTLMPETVMLQKGTGAGGQHRHQQSVLQQQDQQAPRQTRDGDAAGAGAGAGHQQQDQQQQEIAALSPGEQEGRRTAEHRRRDGREERAHLWGDKCERCAMRCEQVAQHRGEERAHWPNSSSSDHAMRHACPTWPKMPNSSSQPAQPRPARRDATRVRAMTPLFLLLRHRFGGLSS